MKDLKIIFINQIDKMLSYTIYKLIIDTNGYIKLEKEHDINKSNFDKFKNSDNLYCYVITNENRILERIYPDRIVTLKGVVDNLYDGRSKILKINNQI